MKTSKQITRRTFSRSLALAGLGTATLKASADQPLQTTMQVPVNAGLKLSLNAYSFDKPLKSGALDLGSLLDYCARTGFDGVDLTGYYFPGYPKPPADDYIFNIKRKAFRLGLGISGTGVRNDFTWADPAKRAEEKKLVRDWITVASKLGAPIVRIFAGTLSKETFTWDDRLKWISDEINECAVFGREHGVMIALQNHNDFLKTSSDVEKIMPLLDRDWTGLLLDIGSYHTSDPYADIALNAKHAISWQLKEKVFINDKQEDTDYSRIIAIVKSCGYRGFLPIETLGDGDPATKVEALLAKVRKALDS